MIDNQGPVVIDSRDPLQRLDTAGFLPYTSVQRALSHPSLAHASALPEAGATSRSALNCCFAALRISTDQVVVHPPGPSPGMTIRQNRREMQ